MIRYALQCDQGHGFDGWFRSAQGFDALCAAGQVGCTTCGSVAVTKALMAPAVAPADTVTARVPKAALTTPANDHETALTALRRQVEAHSEYVGPNFATEARAIHDGVAPGRAIHGEARLDEARRLIEDGIPVAPLPFMPARKVN
jgi:hypothetical protein